MASNAPALAPPQGVTPNFVDPPSLTNAFIVTTTMCLALATASMVVRVTTSLRRLEWRGRTEDCKARISLSIDLKEVIGTTII